MLYLEIVGVFIGLLYLWLEYKASIWLWPVSIIMPALYIYIYYKAGLYADSGINIYFMLAAFYGWIKWSYKKPKHKAAGTKIQHIPLKTLPNSILVILLLWFGLYYILDQYTDSNVPIWDSLSTAISIVAIWMLTQKYVEQWLFWILVNILSVGLYFYKELYLTAGLYGLYSLIAYLGYKKWKEIAFSEASEKIKR